MTRDIPIAPEPREAFYLTLASVPSGYYTSYGALAEACGVHVRQILAWMRTLPEGTKLPWHRVINSQRKISQHPGSQLQAQKLASEGLIPNSSGRYPIEFQWRSN